MGILGTSIGEAAMIYTVNARDAHGSYISTVRAASEAAAASAVQGHWLAQGKEVTITEVYASQWDQEQH